MAKLMISITHAKDNTDKATVGFCCCQRLSRIRR